jgi:hypothetical protein
MAAIQAAGVLLFVGLLSVLLLLISSVSDGILSECVAVQDWVFFGPARPSTAVLHQ